MASKSCRIGLSARQSSQYWRGLQRFNAKKDGTAKVGRKGAAFASVHGPRDPLTGQIQIYGFCRPKRCANAKIPVEGEGKNTAIRTGYWKMLKPHHNLTLCVVAG